MNEARLKSLCVSIDATIIDAMRAIDRGACEIALVVDQGGHLIGTVSDGDVRRALLGGAELGSSISPVITRSPVVVERSTGRAQAIDLMLARSISQVPIIQADGRLVGLHLLREILGLYDRPNVAIIMCGGRGSRLYPLTRDIPKPMISVAGRPILERLVLHLIGSGVRRIFLAVNYLAGMIEDHFGDGHQFGAEVNYIREDPDTPLGTAGALRPFSEQCPEITAPIFVLNGDLVTQFSVEGMLDYHHSMNATATIAVHEHRYQVPYGVVAGNDGMLTGLAEKPVVTWSVNAGIYLLKPSLCRRIPVSEQSTVPDLLQTCLDRHEPVAIWEADGDWHDVGRPADLGAARGLL